MQPYQWLVGVDWGSKLHRVCVLDGDGKQVATRQVEHHGMGQREFVQWLSELVGGRTAEVAVGIEIPRGAIVEGLQERGFAVFAINPKQLDRFRDRYGMGGAKDDGRDAFVLADSLRTDLHCFRRVVIEDALILQIREMSRTRDDLQTEFGRLANQLREQLLRYFPPLLELCPAADEPWLWDLLQMAPLPAQAAKLTGQRVSKLLANRRIRRLDPDQVRKILKSPALVLAPGAEIAASKHALLLLPSLRTAHAQHQQAVKEIAALVQLLPKPTGPEGQLLEHRDADLLLSLPGLGIGIAATMLGEATRALVERDYHALRCYSGLAAVTHQSGKRRTVVMRYACNCRLRNAFYHWARCSMQRDPRSKQHYAQLRQRGHSHGRALRGVADRLLAVLMAVLRSRTPYDPKLRGLHAKHKPSEPQP